jgi:hypothetical protein
MGVSGSKHRPKASGEELFSSEIFNLSCNWLFALTEIEDNLYQYTQELRY